MRTLQKSGPALGLLAIVFVGTLLWAERRYPLRRRVDPGVRRLARNGVLTAIAGITVSLAERPLVEPLAERVERRPFGLVHKLVAGAVWRDALAVTLMDYTLYVWHVLMHRWDPLYRLHQVHHSDLDLDLTTALRFHAGEMLASTPWRVAQVGLLGVSPRALRIWQRLTIAAILFHHSNIRLPRRLEQVLSLFIATPRLHGIHHSIVREEQDSNWSSGLSIWDRLHGTFRTDPSQDKIVIGVPRYRSPDDVTLGKLLPMPLTPPDLARRLPDGEIPKRGSRRASARD
jgi:sterol desaturase/sphingolipid hydroxylase (fatty acid hydroxylase superfamily)